MSVYKIKINHIYKKNSLMEKDNKTIRILITPDKFRGSLNAK